MFSEKSEEGKKEEKAAADEKERSNGEKEKEEEVKERVRSGGRRRKKVKVKKRRKKIGVFQNQASKTGHGTGFISRPPLTNSNPYFKDLNFPSLPLSFDKSADFSKFDAQFGGAVAPSVAPNQGRLTSHPRTQELVSIPPTGSRSRLLLPKRRLFGSKATESGLRNDLTPSSPQLTPLSFPPTQAPIQHQSQMSFNVKEKPRTLLSRTKVRLRPSRVLFGHKSQLGSKRPQMQEPQFFTNVNIRFKPPQFQPSPPQIKNSSPTPVRFQSSHSSGSIQASQDPTQFQLTSFQSPDSLSRFQKSQSQAQLLRGLDGSYTINTDL